MLRAVADTHTVIWYLYDDPRLSAPARAFIESSATGNDQIGISSISLAEIVYLVEKARIPLTALSRAFDALEHADALLREIPLNRSVAIRIPSVPRVEVSDLPDRIIAATALLHDVPVITRDRQIQLSVVPTIW